MTTAVLIIIGVIVLLMAYVLYARAIKRRNAALEALSSVDVQLRKRHDLLPSVLKLAHKFMEHEGTLLEDLTALRSRVQQGYDPKDPDAVQQHLEDEASLQQGMRQLFAVAEGYPELRSVETITQAQQTFNEVEGHIAASRRFYNSAVTDLNNACEIFPSSLFASMAGVKKMPFFEITDASVRAPVDPNEYL